jgi:hypothetical protein
MSAANRFDLFHADMKKEEAGGTHRPPAICWLQFRDNARVRLVAEHGALGLNVRRWSPSPRVRGEGQREGGVAARLRIAVARPLTRIAALRFCNPTSPRTAGRGMRQVLRASSRQGFIAPVALVYTA